MNLFGIGAPEIFVVLIVILVLFGPDRLPELARKIGGASRELRGTLDNLNEQMNNALETSMEMDKARMTPPAQTLPSVTGTPPETPATNELHRTEALTPETNATLEVPPIAEPVPSDTVNPTYPSSVSNADSAPPDSPN